MNILIVKLSAIGDVIHTLPALNALRRHYPDAHITWLVEEAAADLVVGHRAVDRVLVSRRPAWLRQLCRGPHRLAALAEIRQFIRQLRDTRYDLIFDFQGLLKAGLLIFLAHGRRKIGFGPGMQHQEYSYLFLNERVPAISMEMHALERGLQLLKAAGVPAGEVIYDLPVRPVDRQRVAGLLAASGIHGARPLVAINPMTKWDTKNWDNGKFAVLADRLLASYDVDLVFTGGPGDRPAVEKILAAMRGRGANLAGQTSLKELAALYERCRFLISTDTGPMHLAAAAGIPVVALFGPTAPWRTGPYGDRHQVVRLDLPCSPCFKRQCERGECMADLTVEQLMAAVARLTRL
ncbi:MAG: lipopolysaccharide heptosyltransferase II [Deltaproteobacteria bacterium CG23_combo_of_CG06-09_8_20_14_all_60_8]|nr:MAG: lipopolysaccharide heptosyltransferase II [Desulfobacterales bacterium CG2_30_60_27]PIP43178.1 MAG: lipopolysaccharide heptosyltransferase II [Deltaproteobacteria bacterium CG23_combo_of_CG06-09_8_20_14_all_60_8]